MKFFHDTDLFTTKLMIDDLETIIEAMNQEAGSSIIETKVEQIKTSMPSVCILIGYATSKVFNGSLGDARSIYQDFLQFTVNKGKKETALKFKKSLENFLAEVEKQEKLS